LRNTSTEHKTAVLLLVCLEAAITEVEEIFNIKVITVVTDSSGGCCKAHCNLLNKYLYFVVINCYTHQVHFCIISGHPIFI
ncbi:hypothetical protein FIBSPDRAFT_759650, partial [Athelia psychrophila]